MTQNASSSPNIKFMLILALSFVSFLAFISASFVVPQASQVLVFQFGRLQRAIQSPGLYFHIPLVENTVFYDKRMLNFDVSDIEVTLADQKRIVVNTFTRYRICNPEKFYQTVFNERGAKVRLSALVPGFLRSVLSETSLPDLLSERRVRVMYKIRENLNNAASHLGVEILEVRILGTNFPTTNEQAVFERMISGRQREAQHIRSQGREKAAVIRSNAERERAVLIADAKRTCSILQGKGQAEVNKIYSELYRKNQNFLKFYWNLAACEKALAKGTSTVFSTKNGFLSILDQNNRNNHFDLASPKDKRR